MTLNNLLEWLISQGRKSGPELGVRRSFQWRHVDFFKRTVALRPR